MKAKGKIKRDEREHDDALGASLATKVAEHVKPKPSNAVASEVSAGALRGVVSETLARVYEEMWPGMSTRTDRDGGVDIEIAEEGYILVNTMLVGNDVDKPRTGLKIKDAEFSDQAMFCKDHA